MYGASEENMHNIPLASHARGVAWDARPSNGDCTESTGRDHTDIIANGIDPSARTSSSATPPTACSAPTWSPCIRRPVIAHDGPCRQALRTQHHLWRYDET